MTDLVCFQDVCDWTRCFKIKIVLSCKVAWVGADGARGYFTAAKWALNA